ncbi:MAG: hypothetical protein JWP12_3447 [Bacteroidetes bacterium]|nr:hypothetical protein [Bacteroidota bacterium]
MKFRIHFLFLFISISSFAQINDVQANIKYYTEKAQTYLDKEKALSGFYSIDKDGIKMYASAQNKSMQQAEFTISWKDLPELKFELKNCPADVAFNTYQNKIYDAPAPCMFLISPPPPGDPSGIKKLQHLKIAIDPGHIAYDFEMGDLEKKHIKMKADTAAGLLDSMEIAEGMLTYATAQLLKEKLEKEGAEVFLTRKNGNTAFGKTYAQWKKEDLKNAVDSLYKIGELKANQKQYLLSAKAQDRDIFRIIFKDLELAKRAEIINNYKPDLTIIIHYNVDETNKEWEKPGDRDFDMTFVGGAFMKNDLVSLEKRFEFLRLLITDDLEKSIGLSTCVVNSFEKKLNVPTAGITDANYLKEGCLPTKTKGVYCRNLQLTRYIHSPLVYGETLFQDNLSELKLLSMETDKTKNGRVQQVAEAYFQGVLNYIQLNKQ